MLKFINAHIVHYVQVIKTACKPHANCIHYAFNMHPIRIQYASNMHPNFPPKYLMTWHCIKSSSSSRVLFRNFSSCIYFYKLFICFVYLLIVSGTIALLIHMFQSCKFIVKLHSFASVYGLPSGRGVICSLPISSKSSKLNKIAYYRVKYVKSSQLLLSTEHFRKEQINNR